MDTLYPRVLPRDLFNEAKLLKCIGRLTLLIHEGMAPENLEFEHDDAPFEIGLTNDGYLAVANINFTINGEYLFFKSLYNSKNNYPLYLQDNYDEYLVFDENGAFTDEFKEYCSRLLSLSSDEDADNEEEYTAAA